MSAKARFFGFPDAVVTESIQRNVHPDCMVARTNSTSNCCEPCKVTLLAVIDERYAVLTSPMKRAQALAEETRHDQAET